MSGLLYAAVFAVCIALSECQNNTKIRGIYDDMDMNDDGFLYFDDMQAYFKVYTDFLGEESLNFFAFDLIWGLVYNDSNIVTRHFFDTWDRPTMDGNITLKDEQDLFQAIDNFTSNATPGFLDYYFDFQPYFRYLYQEAGVFTRDEIVG